MKHIRLVGFIKEICCWLAKGTILIIGIVLFVIALISIFGILYISYNLIFGSRTFCIETIANIVGCILQIIGTGLTIQGLLKVRKYFKQKPLTQLVLDWWKEFPKWKTNIHINYTGNIPVPVTLLGKQGISHPDDPSQSIEKRFEALLKNFEHLKNTLRKHEDAIEKLSDSHEKHKKEVEENSKNMKDHFQSTLETLHTSDLIRSLVLDVQVFKLFAS